MTRALPRCYRRGRLTPTGQIGGIGSSRRLAARVSPDALMLLAQILINMHKGRSQKSTNPHARLREGALFIVLMVVNLTVEV